MKYQGFIGPAYTHQSLQVSSQTCKNLYIETTENMGKESLILKGTPGYTKFAEIIQSTPPPERWWGKKHPNDDYETFEECRLVSGGDIVAYRISTKDFAFPGISAQPPWTGTIYLWSFKGLPSTIYPTPGCRIGFTDSNWNGDTYDFWNKETGNRVYIRMNVNHYNFNEAGLKLYAFSDMADEYTGDPLEPRTPLVTYSNISLSDLAASGIQVELSGNQARVLSGGIGLIGPGTDVNGWITYVGIQDGPASPLPTNAKKWVQFDGNFDTSEKELIFSDKPLPGYSLDDLLRTVLNIDTSEEEDVIYGGCRGLFYTTQNRLFVVRGYSVVEVTIDGIEIFVGSLLTNNGPVSIAENVNQIMFTDGMYGYILTKADNTLVQITDPSFPVPGFVIYQDGYFITNNVGTNQFYLSQLNDGLVWTPVTFVSAEGSPDIITKIASTNGQLWIWGEKSYEIWYNAGDPLFPYQRVPGSYNSIGLLATESVSVILNNVFFLGGNKDGFGTVYQSNGYQVQQISTYPIEAEISGFRSPEDAIGFTYQQEGHYFYVLSFQAGNKTFVYDINEKAWHTRTSYNTISNTEGRWRALYQVFAFNKNIVGDYNTGNLWELSTSVYTENGTPILRERTAPVLFSNDDYKFIFYKGLEIDMQVGVGLNVGQGGIPPPVVMLQFSDDGMTWSNEYWQSMGKIGEYSTRVKWNRLGRSKYRIFRIRISDPVKVVIIGAVIDIQKGEN